MDAIELILLIFGGVVFTISFFLPAGRREKSDGISPNTEEQIREIINREVEGARSQIGNIVDETITYSMEKTERSMDRLTNEKMLAVNEYSDTVLEQINKNHKEAVFLYDMLNDKHENLKTTVSEAMKTATEVKQTVKDAEVTAKEVSQQAKEVREQISKETEETEEKGLEFTPFQAEIIEEVIVPETAQIPETAQTPAMAQISETAQIPEEEQAEEQKKPRKRAARKPKNEETQKKASQVDLSMAAQNAAGRNNNERILELHKAGKSNVAIAKELGLGIGEVKLVIDLFEGI